MEQCAECGGKRFKATTMTDRVEISGVVFNGEIPAHECVKCGHQYAHADQLAKFELAVAERLARLGIRTGAAFKFMRKVLQMRAVDLAELLDVTAETISRWETGEPEARAFALLGSMVSERMRGDQQTVERLRALRSPPPRPTRVKVTAA
jgi:putative zinc finger/helix-turn-helix YgiT family protein